MKQRRLIQREVKLLSSKACLKLSLETRMLALKVIEAQLDSLNSKTENKQGGSIQAQDQHQFPSKERLSSSSEINCLFSTSIHGATPQAGKSVTWRLMRDNGSASLGKRISTDTQNEDDISSLFVWSAQM